MVPAIAADLLCLGPGPLMLRVETGTVTLLE